MNMTGHRRREAEAFEDRFAIGEKIIRYMKQHGCSKAAACEHFQSQTRLQSAALKAAHTTAKTFPHAERNRSVGYTKHQSLAQVSRKNFRCTDEEYKLGLREALSEIALKHLPVNVLNGDGRDNAKSVLGRAIRRIQTGRSGTGNQKNFEARFPLVHGTRAITPEDVGRLQDDT
jgi:hypothetical protein